MNEWDVIIRLSAALLLCAAIGLEREIRGQVAGLRTHILVGVGAALFTLISAYGFQDFVRPNPEGGFITTVDPTRIAAQVVAGIGFLGAGAIITQGVTVRGLTTAAALWIAAAIGMAAGAGYFIGAGTATLIVLLSLIGVRKIRPLFIHRLRQEIVFLELRIRGNKAMGQLFRTFANYDVSVQTMDPKDEDGYHFELAIPGDINIGEFEQEIAETKGLKIRSARTARGDAFN